VRGNSATKHDHSPAQLEKTLRGQFSSFYDQKKIGNIYIASNSGSTPKAIAEVKAGGKSQAIPIDLQSQPARWLDLGVYSFGGRGDESIRIINQGSGSLRLSGLRLDILDPQDHKQVWQTLILDDLTAYDAKAFNPQKVSFTDLPATDPLADIAARLVESGIIEGASGSVFGPTQVMRTADFTAALARSLNRTSTEKLDSAAAAVLAQRQGWALGGAASAHLSLREAFTLMVSAARCGLRPLAWVKPPANPADTGAWAQALGLYQGVGDPVLTGDSLLNRGQAVVLLDRFTRQLMHAGPPSGTGWDLAFADEFNGDQLDKAIWQVAKNQTWGKLLSVRTQENVVVKDGVMRLLVRKEKRAGKEWTTAMLDTGKAFRQTYGYWEARYRYAQAPGLNNAFWLHSGKTALKNKGFEIDINEGHWPNTVNMSLHQEGLPSLSKGWRAPVDLGLGWHVYAVDWNEKEIIYYWDGREVDRKPNTNGHSDSAIIFSTAVFPWAGPITDRLDGTSMDVDWVRVWQRPPAKP
jgi:beta-glucanase (GH16 family)